MDKFDLIDGIAVQVDNIDKRLSEVVSKYEEKFAATDMQISQLSANVNKNENDIMRMERLNELRIIGIPFSPNENLQEIFASISDSIKYNSTTMFNFPSLFRIGANNRNVTNPNAISSAIIARFQTKMIKQNFYSCYLSNKNRTLKNIGFNRDGNYLISENLTKFNKNLFDQAYILKRESKVHQVYTIDGLVYIRKQVGQKSTVIRCSSDLLSIQN